MEITVIETSCFEDIIVLGSVSDIDKKEILELKKGIPFDEYAGYSPDCQDKFKKIEKVLKKYAKPHIFRI